MTATFYTSVAPRNEAHEAKMTHQFANGVSIKHLNASGLDFGNRTVLDVGCGTSTSLAEFLAGKGAVYHGIDAVQSTVDVMNTNLTNLGLPANVTVGDITDLDQTFADQSFDFVHERLVLMHVPDRGRGLGQSLRIARQAAVFISIDWSAFRYTHAWVGQFYRKTVEFFESRGSDMSWGGKIFEILSCSPYQVQQAFYERPYGDHADMVIGTCETLLGRLKTEPTPDQRLVEFFTRTAERARREGAFCTPGLMSVVTVFKEEPETTSAGLGRKFL